LAKVIPAERARGTGKPDFYKHVKVAAPAIIAPEQTSVTALWTGVVPAESYVDVHPITVPAGKVMYIGTGGLCCDRSLIQRADMMQDGVSVSALYYDLNGMFTFPTIGIYEVPEGSTFGVRLYNYDTEVRTFSGILSGVFETRV